MINYHKIIDVFSYVFPYDFICSVNYNLFINLSNSIINPYFMFNYVNYFIKTIFIFSSSFKFLVNFINCSNINFVISFILSNFNIISTKGFTVLFNFIL